MTGSSTAYTTLMSVAINARHAASGLPAQTGIKRSWSGIGFILFGERFVAPMGEVSELLELPHYAHLPGAQAWVLGLANVRSRLLPLIDMAAFLDGQLDALRRKRRVLVIETEQIYSGLIVDQVVGMQHLLADSYVPTIAVEASVAMLPYLQGSLRDDSGSDWTVFSPWALVRDAKFSKPESIYA